MPQSPKTLGFAQTTPTIKSEMDAKCLSASSTPNNNTIFSFPSIPSQEEMSKANNIQYSSPSAFRHQEGKQLDVNDVNVNVNVVASSSASSHETVSTSSNYLSSESSSTNNTDTQSSKLNVINVCDGSDKTKPKNDGIIITDAQAEPVTAATGFYDSINMEGNGDTTTAIIYETIVIENPPMTTPQNQQQEIISFVTAGSSNNNNKLIANKNVSIESVGNGGILVLTGSLNDLLNSHVISNCLTSQSSSGAGTNISKCLNSNDKKSNTNHIQSIVLNLNSQSSSAPTSGQLLSAGGQKSIRLAINPNQQVCFKHYV